MRGVSSSEEANDKLLRFLFLKCGNKAGRPVKLYDGKRLLSIRMGWRKMLLACVSIVRNKVHEIIGQMPHNLLNFYAASLQARS